VPDPAKQWFPKRRVHGWVTFDSGGRAIAVEVHYSLNDPI
jgi:hypothetical protein